MVTDDSTRLLELAEGADAAMRAKSQVGWDPVNAALDGIFMLNGRERVDAASIWTDQLEKMLMERGEVTSGDVVRSARRAVEHVRGSGGSGDFDFR